MCARWVICLKTNSPSLASETNNFKLDNFSYDELKALNEKLDTQFNIGEDLWDYERCNKLKKI